jgi:alkanesulfonate monooxygenase SsuD/methylene tetrahydromethanopterin reductase-like flavin-dependent oxidoreductase (luciferase family)
MKFGVFDHMDRGTLPLAEHYENRLRLIEAYDEAGFYGYHVAEHHSTPLGMAPSPSVFLSAIAQRTERLRFGPLIYPLPLHHPIRLMEEICMLDHLSNGRLDVGIGRGAVPYEIEYYGSDPKEAQARYMEAYAVLLKALTSRTLTHNGKYYRFNDVPLEIAPLQQPHPPFWYGAVNEDGATWAAQNRINIVCNAPLDAVRTIIARYRKEWAAAGHSMDDIPILGTNRYVVIADSDSAAYEIAAELRGGAATDLRHRRHTRHGAARALGADRGGRQQLHDLPVCVRRLDACGVALLAQAVPRRGDAGAQRDEAGGGVAKLSDASFRGADEVREPGIHTPQP